MIMGAFCLPLAGLESRRSKEAPLALGIGVSVVETDLVTLLIPDLR